MIQKIKNILAPLALVLSLAVPVAMPVSAFAAANTDCSNGIANSVADGASDAGGSGSYGCGSLGGTSATSSVGNLAYNIVKIFSIVVGAVAVIMLIYGGFRYITSAGSSDKVGNAKNTLLYAIIGLVIVALAQLIVHFVLNQTNNVSNGGGITQTSGSVTVPRDL